MYGLAPIGYLSGAGLKVTESSRGGGRRVSQRDFNGNQTLRRGPPSPEEQDGWAVQPPGLPSGH